MIILLKLFWSFLQIGAFSFGGGYAALRLIQEQVVDVHGWLTMTEFADVVTISQMTPGPIAINAATFVGTQQAGLAGALTASLAVTLPSLVISLLLAMIYYRYRTLRVMQGILRMLRPAVVALIAAAGLSMLRNAFWPAGAIDLAGVDWIAVGIFVISLAVLRLKKPDPILVMTGAGAVGLILYSL